jgi:hypothetical protein
MRIALALVSALAIASAVAACGDHDHEDYATLQDCMVDHTQVEMLPEVQALTVCLVDHLDVSFSTTAECEAYVEAHGGYPASRVDACAEYIRQQGL